MALAYKTTPPAPSLFDYGYSRIREIGLTIQEAWEHGIQINDSDGNIEILIRDFNGNTTRYTPRVKTTNDHGDKIYKSAGYKIQERLIRLHPANIKPENPGLKYVWPSARPTRIMPTNLAIQNYQRGKTGGTIFSGEGYLKALVLSLNGVEADAFNGIHSYNIKGQTKDYILTRNPDDFVIFYDADAREIRQDKETGVWLDKRKKGFKASAENFARDWFAWIDQHNEYAKTEAEKIRTKLHFCMVSELQDEKGVDDLIHAKGADKVIPALESLKTSEYFEFIELKKSRYEKQLKDFFAFNNPYTYYQFHREQIGFEPFTFSGVTYQRTIPETGKGLFGQDGIYLKMQSNPLNIDLDKLSKIRINKHLRERKNAILDTISREYKTYIEAPTGAGKTYFFAKELKERIVIAAPTKNLTLQIANEYKMPSITGGMKPKDRAKALQAKKVVCTYEMLHAIHDLHSRYLVIDEAHNLTNHYSFRDKPLNYISELISNEVPEKIILLSGTPNRLLCKAWDFHFIEVSRRLSNDVLINPVTAKNASTKALQTATIEVLQRIDWKATDKTHFVFWNSSKNVRAIRDWMVKYSELKAGEIAIIDRPEVDAGNDKQYNEIISHSHLTGVKLVLCTQLIAEGVNIENKDIGSIIVVNLFCPDTFRQFVARFRKVKKLIVHDIKPPEKATGKGWIKDVWREYQYKSESIAQQEKSHLERERAERYSELSDTEMEHPKILNPEYYHESEFIHYGYTEAGQVYINDLKIFSEIRDSILKNSNNTFFYTQVTQQAWININSASEAIQESETISEQLNEVQNAIQERQETIQANLIADLKQRPSLPISALQKHYKAKNDYGAAKRIAKRVPELIQDSKEAEQYRLNNPEIFSDRTMTGLILDAIRLHAIQLPPDEIANILDNYKPAKFAETWRAYRYQVESELYKDRNKRKVFKPEHRLDLKAFGRIAADFDQKLPETLSEATRRINNLIRPVSKKAKEYLKETNIKIKSLQTISEAETLSILKRLYQVEAKAGFNYKTWTIYDKHKNGAKMTKQIVKSQRDKILSIKAHPEIFSTAKATSDHRLYIKLFL